VGERLSYGMALALVVVAQQIATAGMIPVSNERLWIDKFIAWSFYWVIVGLLESVFVGYIFFLREDHFSKETEEEKRSKIYDGVRESVLMGPLGNSSGSSSEQASTERQPPTQQSVDNNYQPQSNSNWGASCSTDDLEEALNRERNSTAETPAVRSTNNAVTLKMQLKQSVNQTPRTNRQQEFTRTMTNREVNAEESGREKVKTLRWKWMYTFSLRKLDRFFFFFTLVTYSLFLIAMFGTRELWGKNAEVVWLATGEEIDLEW
jgi:hypothetical protein